ncbi:hypothetical protein LWI29_027818 [Acer saccharum]|uniref:Uncharacterized protein n=1 Tax=Acer saccharum TaxID=4024 RepID=A0AA39S742_ACESA|nr:hypothetical protein LWI29_027818 [Acer saccharum]
MSEYLTAMKQITDNLALAKQPIYDSYLISSVVLGLVAEYLHVTCQINARGVISWQEAHATLMTFENALTQLNLISNGGTDLGNAMANFARHKQNNNNNNSSFNNKNQNSKQFKGQGRGYGNEAMRSAGRRSLLTYSTERGALTADINTIAITEII